MCDNYLIASAITLLAAILVLIYAFIQWSLSGFASEIPMNYLYVAIGLCITCNIFVYLWENNYKRKLKQTSVYIARKHGRPKNVYHNGANTEFIEED